MFFFCKSLYQLSKVVHWVNSKPAGSKFVIYQILLSNNIDALKFETHQWAGRLSQRLDVHYAFGVMHCVYAKYTLFLGSQAHFRVCVKVLQKQGWDANERWFSSPIKATRKLNTLPKTILFCQRSKFSSCANHQIFLSGSPPPHPPYHLDVT